MEMTNLRWYTKRKKNWMNIYYGIRRRNLKSRHKMVIFIFCVALTINLLQVKSII